MATEEKTEVYEVLEFDDGKYQGKVTVLDGTLDDASLRKASASTDVNAFEDFLEFVVTSEDFGRLLSWLREKLKKEG